MKKTFDSIVIGAGSGGLNIAGFMVKAGFSVLLVDKSDAHIGGDCLNFGCVPSKALIHVAKTVHAAKSAHQFGIDAQGKADMQKVVAYIKSKKDFIRTHENKAYFESIGMTVVLGHATFTSSHSIQVDGTEYYGKRIVLATGSRPRTYTVKGIEHVHVLTNETIFEIEHLPEKLLIVGGGPISIEIGQAFAYLGSKVAIVVKDKRILPREDESIALVLQKRMEQEGVQFYFESVIEEIQSKTQAYIKTQNGNVTHEFDQFFVAIGRELNSEGLDLEKAGIRQHDKKNIIVNKYLETTQKSVLLCGDIVGQHQFTHAAELHAAVIIRNFFVPNWLPFLKKKLNTDHLAWVTYTNPEIATFGLSKAEIEKRSIVHTVIEQNFDEDDRAIVEEGTYGKAKIFVSHDGYLLGGSMVAPNAGELIQEFILAETNKIPVSAFFAKIYPYPTASRVNKRIISNIYKEKLTPLVKKVMKILY